MSNVKNENAGFYFWDHKLTPSTLFFSGDRLQKSQQNLSTKFGKYLFMQVTNIFFIRTPKVWFCSTDL